MFSSVKTLAVVAATAALAVRADIVVSTPAQLVQCEPATFTISGSDTGPFYGFVVDSAQPCEDALKEIDNITGNSFEWVVDLPVGSSVMIAIENDAGTEGWSGALEVVAGSASCLSSASSSQRPSATTSGRLTVNTANVDTPENAQEDTPGAASRNVAVGSASAVALISAAFVALMF